MPYYVYLLASKKHGTLYLGVTNDIVRRGYEHRIKAVQGFTKRYAVDKMVWFEIYDDALAAIAREKELRHCKLTFGVMDSGLDASRRPGMTNDGAPSGLWGFIRATE